MKIFSMILITILMIALLTASCTTEKPETSGFDRAEYHKISAAEAKARIDSGDNVIIVDVRTEEEYTTEHIPGAILIPNDTIVDSQPELLPDLNAEILIYCRSGNRSAQAASKLVKIGYHKVYDFGGIIDWPYNTSSGLE